MRIAIPTRNNQVDGHFGHCEYYTIFTINEDKSIAGSQIMESPQGCGCKSDIANVLHVMGVSLMLAGNMGPGAVSKLNGSGIQVVRGCSGDVNDVVMDYLSEKITDSGVSCDQNEHQQHRGESCNH